MFNQNQLDLIESMILSVPEPLLLITCTGNVKDLEDILDYAVYRGANGKSVRFISVSDIKYLDMDDTVYIVERLGESIFDYDDLIAKHNRLISVETTKERIKNHHKSSVSTTTVSAGLSLSPFKSVQNIGIRIPNSMTDVDISNVDTLIIQYNPSDIPVETAMSEVRRYIKEKSTSYIGELVSFGYTDTSDLNYPKAGQKLWRRIVFEPVCPPYTKESDALSRFSGDNPIVVMMYTSKNMPQYTMRALIGGV